MLAHRTPPSSVCANIMSVVQLLVPNVTIVKELPGIRFVRYCRTVLAQVTQTLAAYEIALADAIQQSHTDGTSRRQTAMQNFVVRVLREGGSRRITLSSCILAEDESSASIAAAIIREFKHSGELLTQWRDATEKLYPDQQDLLKKFQRLLISQWPNWVLEASPQQKHCCDFRKSAKRWVWKRSKQQWYFIFLIQIDPNHELIQIENGLYIRFYETPSNREA
jgi:hypothetical protein